jgi:prepilin-type N-terminal cleavage/methylation domain-containing protein/prepilin-type processing-associated H-X9-DG protein
MALAVVGRGRPVVTHRRADQFRGMTLVELLVVLGILSILAAITMPVFRYGVVSVQRSACLSNLRQASMSLEMYSEDWDRTFPSFRADPSSAVRADDYVYWYNHFCRGLYLSRGQVTWASLTAPYALSSQIPSGASDVFFCPADNDRVTRPITSYEFKMWLAQGRQVAEVATPSDMAMAWEQWAYHMDPQYNEFDRRAAMNIGFVDGHVKWIRLSDTTSALYGAGPDLRWPFVGSGAASSYTGQDVAD